MLNQLRLCPAWTVEEIVVRLSSGTCRDHVDDPTTKLKCAPPTALQYRRFLLVTHRVALGSREPPLERMARLSFIPLELYAPLFVFYSSLVSVSSWERCDRSNSLVPCISASPEVFWRSWVVLLPVIRGIYLSPADVRSTFITLGIVIVN